MKKEINLKDSNFKSKKSTNLSFSIFLLGFLLIAFSVVFMLNFFINKKLDKISKEIKNYENFLSNKESKEVYEFGANLIKFNDLMENKKILQQTSNIIKISEKTSPLVHFGNLSIGTENGFSTFSFELIAPDIEVLVKQIKTYREMEELSELSFDSVSKISDEKQGTTFFSTKVVIALGEKEEKLSSEEDIKNF